MSNGKQEPGRHDCQIGERYKMFGVAARKLTEALSTDARMDLRTIGLNRGVQSRSSPNRPSSTIPFCEAETRRPPTDSKNEATDPTEQGAVSAEECPEHDEPTQQLEMLD